MPDSESRSKTPERMALWMIFCLYCLTPGIYAHSSEKTTFIFIRKDSTDNARSGYTKKVLTLALERTKSDYGEYEIIHEKPAVTVPRLLRNLKSRNDNFFFKASVTDKIHKDFRAVSFPIDRGMIGYRIGIIHSKNANKLTDIKNLSQLKKHKIVQAQGWLDSNILTRNGLNTYDVENKSKCLQMILRRRADIFFRGVNEVNHELNAFNNIVSNLHLIAEPNIALQYPMPKFFITSKRNKRNAERIELGLKRAFDDKSFVKLWEEYNLEEIKSQRLTERIIFELDNPYITRLGNEYKKYNYLVSTIYK